MTPWLIAGGAPAPMRAAFGVMGIINATPDSFYDGGACAAPEAAAERARALLRDGADVLDVGAESTRPGAKAIPAQIELARLVPALRAIRHAAPSAVISVDTRNSTAARAALAMGCSIINDVSACRHDAELLEVLAEFKPGYALTHAQGDPETMQLAPAYGDAVDDIKRFFEDALARLGAAGLPEDRIALDPGIGFGKTLAHNLEILRRFGEFAQFGRPLLAGLSMKGFLGSLLHLGAGERGEATAVASALLFTKGAIWHRVHEPGRVRQALALAEALR